MVICLLCVAGSLNPCAITDFRSFAPQLSYIAGAITGHPDIKVVTSIRGKPEIMLAPEALKLHGIEKVVMGPKEGLGLVNGTAVSGERFALFPTPNLHC